ncbi:predicted protein [Chaetomium globosum CBS 148.51]|uniref:Uncharacterized protein n=1 Tax=Chaetomium globosum (strain ATCC 6205 / CBS 148.51 / DSM 1962 / NBRC 6347 / NRRL 1970) TaxID=306901 RepID=Q2HCK3_CHAGB|nr:uncharacterized protein CHGG_02051 [Chaetomium globosum CBS 148.51]EAQ93816.1 predicted protein [Chaetomium globosum CBS 148.51]
MSPPLMASGAHGALAGPSVSQPTGTTPSNFQGITRTTSQRMIQVPIIPTSDTGSVHSRSVVQQQTGQCTTPGATVNAPTTEATPAAKTSPPGFSAGDSTTTAQATPVTRASNRNSRKSQRALQADSNTQEAHINTRGVTARRSGTLASRDKRAGGGDSGKPMSRPGKQQQRARLGRNTPVDDQESEGYSNL